MAATLFATRLAQRRERGLRASAPNHEKRDRHEPLEGQQCRGDGAVTTSGAGSAHGSDEFICCLQVLSQHQQHLSDLGLRLIQAGWTKAYDLAAARAAQVRVQCEPISIQGNDVVVELALPCRPERLLELGQALALFFDQLALVVAPRTV